MTSGQSVAEEFRSESRLTKVLGWTAFAVMVAGLVITAVPLLGNQATVLFTFYPPMKAQEAFSLGLTLVVAATWLVARELYGTYNAWRAKHRDDWLDSRHRCATGPHPLLVHRPSHRLLLAPTSVRFLVHDGSETGGRPTLQRSHGTRLVHSLPDTFHSGRHPSSICRSQHSSKLEVAPCLFDLRGVLPKSADLL